MAERLTAQGHANRRQHLVEVTIRVIAQNGLEGATMRKVAQAARVSTGSISYYFDGKDDLYFAAFLQFANNSVATFEGFYEGVATLTEARAATVRMLTETAKDHEAVVLATELYCVSLRRPRFHLITDQWSKRCRAVMERYFDEGTVLSIDAFYEGVLLYRGLRLGELSDERLALTVERMTPPESFLG
ncbi:TetR/AcrR family transcriptional regulator [Corynebacterium sp. S7]